jgi:DNA-binding winged helix-turn-helix (wHTH) protein/tetratricopeptide (TPR) repeat protein
MLYRFGNHEIDDALRELRRDGETVNVEPKVFDLLVYLVRNRDRVVSKTELYGQLWAEEAIAPASLLSCVKWARKAVNDSGERQRVIKTFHGRGYRFVAVCGDEGAARVGSLPGHVETPPRLSMRPLRGDQPDFVGRAREIARLDAALDEALAGRGRLLLLAGQPGIGKTRMLDEFSSSARARGAMLLAGRCYEGEGSPALWPWIQLVRSFVATAPADLLAGLLTPATADLVQLVPGLRERFPTLAVSPLADAGQARIRLFESLRSFLTSAAAVQPLVLALDDLHCADGPSLLMLEFLIREAGTARMLILGAYQNIEVQPDHPLARLIANLGREGGCEVVELTGLEEDQVGVLSLQLMGTVAAEVARLVARQTEGNPLFVEAICRHLLEEGIVDSGDGSWRGPLEPGAVGLPETVRAMISRRLARLQASSCRVLSVAAVIGREFDYDLLAVASGFSFGKLLDALEEAAAARVVVELPSTPGRFAFTHALIRECLYTELSSVRRVQLHRQIGEALEERCGSEAGPHLAALAHHFFQCLASDCVEKAVNYAERAGQQAAAELAYGEAARHFTRALQALERRKPADEARRCELLLALGEALFRGGNDRWAHDTFLRAADVARKIGSVEQLARAAWGFGGMQRGAHLVDESDVRLSEEAVEAVGAKDIALRARGLAHLAYMLHYFPQAQERTAAVSREAVRLARRAGDRTTLARALHGQHFASWVPEGIQERLRVASELIGLAEDLGDGDMLLEGHGFRALDLLQMGDATEAFAAIDTYARLAEDHKEPWYRWLATCFHVLPATITGRFEEAEKLIDEAQALGQRVNDRDALLISTAQRLAFAITRGGEVVLEPSFPEVMRQHPRRSRLQAWLAYARSEQRDFEQARKSLDQLAADGFASPPDNLWLSSLALLSLVSVRCGTSECTARLFKLMEPYAHHGVVMPYAGWLGSVSHYLGILAGALGRRRIAVQRFGDALAHHTRMGAIPWTVHTRCEHARLLLAHDRPADRPRALRLLDQALAEARRLGMSHSVEWITGVLGADPRSRDDTGDLAHGALKPSAGSPRR